MQGSFAVHREMKKSMAGFLFLGLFYIASWAAMFHSPAFHWTFFSWAFFASLTVVAFVILIVGGVLGLVCWRNLNEGLAYCRLCFAFFYVKYRLTIEHSLHRGCVGQSGLSARGNYQRPGNRFYQCCCRRCQI